MPHITIPELHPILVHFPIALLLTSVALDFVALRWRSTHLIAAATWCLALGVIGAVAAGISGELAAHRVAKRDTGSIVELHQRLAILTGATFAFLLVVRLLLLSPRILASLRPSVRLAATAEIHLQRALPALFAERPARGVIALYLTLSLVGTLLLAATGYLGGSLVYDHGIGTPSGLTAPPLGIALPR